MISVENEDESPEEMDYCNAPSLDYSVEDLIKIITVKTPGIKEGNETIYEQIIDEVIINVCEEEKDYRKLTEKLPINLDDIFDPTIQIHIVVIEMPHFVIFVQFFNNP
jgi:hypothetical protein